MRNVFLAVLSLTCFAATAKAEDSVSPEMVAAVKAATVFIKIEVEGLSGSGSGFVIKTEGDTAYVVSNCHVVEPKAIEVIRVPTANFSETNSKIVRQRPPYPGGPRPVPGGVPRPYPGQPRSPYAPSPRNPYGQRPYVPPSPYPGAPQYPVPRYVTPSHRTHVILRSFKNVAVTVVFQSGTKTEEAIRGEVVCVDPEQDLALIKVSGVKALPKPIDFLLETKLVETLPVYTFGYPFGKALATSKGSPAITVGKGSISSLRLDDDGDLALVQIDGAMNPGNSGGPVVDTQGRLVGVAVATIRNSSGIGLAVPSRAIQKMLDGRIMGEGLLTTSQDADGIVTVHVEVGLVDPMNKVRTATLHYLVGKTDKDQIKPADALEKLPDCRTLALTVEKQIAKGDIILKKEESGASLLYQTAYVNEAQEKKLNKHVVEKIKVKPAAPPKKDVPIARPADKPATTNPDKTARPATRPTTTRPKKEPDAPVLGGYTQPVFSESAPEKWVLVGLELGVAKYQKDDAIRSVRPIFLNAQGEEVLGERHGTETSRLVQIKAKKGYAIAAMTGAADRILHGMSVTFMQVDKDRLNPKEAYESEWVGGKGKGETARLGGDGSLVVGIVGRKSQRHCYGLGLLFGPSEKQNQETADQKPVAGDTKSAVQGTISR